MRPLFILLRDAIFNVTRRIVNKERQRVQGDARKRLPAQQIHICEHSIHICEHFASFPNQATRKYY